MSKITYKDKVALYENTDIPDINKVKADDMNEIKEVVNGIDTTANTNKTNIGTLSNLNTTSKDNLVSAINEVDTDIGTMSNLDTTQRSTLVGAINEVNANLNANKNVYSTSETVIGTWMNKTLYRKVYKLTTVDGTNTYTIDISSLKATHSWINTGESFVESTSGEVKGFNYFEDATNFYLRGLITNNKTITVKVAGGQYYCGPTYVCLEYTKN